MKRRDLLIAATAVSAVMALPALRGLMRPAFAFEPIPGLPGFRRLPSAGVSGAPAALAGVEPVTPLVRHLRDSVSAAPCTALFGADGWTEGVVPVVVFTDYNCPYCPTMSDLVIRLVDEGAPVRVIWKDLPVLGPRSVAAARVAVAAGFQGQYLPVHRRLMRSVLRPGPAALRALAAEFGLDAIRLEKDMRDEAVSRALDHTAALAAVVGVVGTPGTMVGRTLVSGAIDYRDLLRLTELEANTPFAGCQS